MEARGNLDDPCHRNAVRLEFFCQNFRAVHETVTGDVDINIHGLGSFNHRDPLRRVRRPHGWEYPVEVRLAHEQDLLRREIDDEVSPCVGSA